MKKIKTTNIKIKELSTLENSRMLGVKDVSDLIGDIQLHGQLQPIGVRKEDYAIIYGNRRVEALKKLGREEVIADIYEDVSDEDLIVLNVVENIKRKNIGSIELGRVCNLLKDKDLTLNEISKRLGIHRNRVESSISAYNVTKGTPFESLVTHGNPGASKNGIPEFIIWKVQNSLSRARKLTQEDWAYLLKEIESGKLTSHHVTELRKLLMSNRHMSVKEALRMLDSCKLLHEYFTLNKVRLNELMLREGFSNEREFINFIIRKYDKDLMF